MKRIVVTLAESEAAKVHAFAESLKKDGLEVSNVSPLGIIFGKAEDAVIERLRQRKEIASLEEEPQIRIAPPDSDIQ